MHARHALFAVLTALVLWAVPDTARADVKMARSEQREREGFVLGLRMMSGTTLHGPQGFTPVSRISYTLGGAISRRFVLGADLGVTGWWDDKKASFHGDTFGQLFVIGGLFVRASVGVASHTYVAGARRAAVGGSLGAGWEFPLGKKGFISLVGDYDARYRSDRTPVRTVLFGLRIGAYLKK